MDNRLQDAFWQFPDKETFDLITYLKPYVDHGKRFRPYMVYVRYTLSWWEDIDYIVSVWLIHELIHIFALIHDDICDNWVMRHNIPCYHSELGVRYQNEHIWLSQAMLVGDLVYTRAMQEAAQLLSWKEAHNLVFSMLNEVVIGQIVDVHFSTPQDQERSKKEIANKDHLKSGQYTFQKPMMVWSSLAWVKDLSAIEDLWKKIWIAFQMRDDLLDRVPNKEGKTKMSDIQEWNQTIVMTTCREEYDQDARSRLRNQRWKELTEEKNQLLQQDFERFDIEKLVTKTIGDLLDEVEVDFLALGHDAPISSEFINVINILRKIG